MENPFAEISPGGIIVGSQKKIIADFKKNLTQLLKGKIIVALVGSHGSGRSYFLKKINEFLETKKKSILTLYHSFTPDILKKLSSMPAEKSFKKEVVLLLDNVDFLTELHPDLISKTLEIMLNLSNHGFTIIAAMTKETLQRLEQLDEGFKKSVDILTIPSLNFNEAKELVLNRLNEIRTKKSNDLKPFTEKEIRDIWKKSNGNPKMILLFCAYLFKERIK